MTMWASNQMSDIFNQVQGGSALAGLTGSPAVRRSTEIRGITKVINFNVAQAAMKPLPGNSLGSGLVLGDSIILALLAPTDWVYFGRIYWNAWGGTGLTLAIGKYDVNTATATVNRYLAATSITAASNADINTNVPEQVGTDPAGDQSAGNAIPGFGSLPVYLTATIAGTTLATGGLLSGYFLIVEQGN